MSLTQSEAVQRLTEGAEKREAALKVRIGLCGGGNGAQLQGRAGSSYHHHRAVSQPRYAYFIHLCSAPLQDERQRLAKRLDAAQLCIEALQGELSMLQQVGVEAGMRAYM